MITRRTVLGGIVAVSAGGRTAHATPAVMPKEFRIGYQKSGVLVVARRQATIEAKLKELGIGSVRWIEFQYGPPVMEALGVGAVDFGYVGDTPPIFAQAAGTAIVYVAATPAQQNSTLLPSNSTIRTLADLRGRRLAFAKGSSSHNFVVQALSKAGLSPADISPVFLTPADAIAAFTRGSVDAWAVWDPYFALAEMRLNAKALTTTEGILDSKAFYLSNRDFASRNPSVLKAVLDGVQQSTEWASGHRDELAQAISDVTAVDIAVERRAVARIKIELLPMTERIIQGQQAIADTFYRLGLIPRAVAVHEDVWPLS